MTAAIASAQNTVALSDNASFGTILTDANGMTLYTWQGDALGVNNCTEQCAGAWPTVTTSSSTVNAPAGLTGVLGAAEQADGTWVVTYNNWPLHRFSRDTAPGDTNGQGSNGFGARRGRAGAAGRDVDTDADADRNANPSGRSHGRRDHDGFQFHAAKHSDRGWRYRSVDQPWAGSAHGDQRQPDDGI